MPHEARAQREYNYLRYTSDGPIDPTFKLNNYSCGLLRNDQNMVRFDSVGCFQSTFKLEDTSFNFRVKFTEADASGRTYQIRHIAVLATDEKAKFKDGIMLETTPWFIPGPAGDGRNLTYLANLHGGQLPKRYDICFRVISGYINYLGDMGIRPKGPITRAQLKHAFGIRALVIPELILRFVKDPLANHARHALDVQSELYAQEGISRANARAILYGDNLWYRNNLDLGETNLFATPLAMAGDKRSKVEGVLEQDTVRPFKNEEFIVNTLKDILKEHVAVDLVVDVIKLNTKMFDSKAGHVWLASLCVTFDPDEPRAVLVRGLAHFVSKMGTHSILWDEFAGQLHSLTVSLVSFETGYVREFLTLSSKLDDT